jgi:hypothetical protein
MRLWVFGLVLSLIMTLAAPAWSRPPLVLILESPANEAVTELVTRVQGELVAAGADVQRVPPPSAELEPASRVLVAAEALGAVAAFEIEVLAEGSVRIWFADRLGPEPVVRHVDVARTDQTSTAAVRAVELLRVSFLQRLIDAQHRPARGDEREPARPRPIPPASFASWALELGPALLSSFEGVGHQVALAGRIGYFPLPSFGIRLNGLGLGKGTLTEGALGNASLQQQLVYLDAAWLFAGKPLRPLVSAGVGAYHLDVEGSPSAGFVGKSESFWGFSVVLGAGAVVSLSQTLSLSFSLNAVLVFPQPQIHLGEPSPAARAGRPSLLGNSMLGAWF